MAVLVLQSFGRESEYKRAILTMLSYFAHIPQPFDGSKVLLFTDKPGYFGPYVKGLNVEYVLLTPEKIRGMRGEIDFLHRMKIALIEEAFSLTDDNLLYADSDTFFTASPLPLAEQLSPGKAFMHLLEYPFNEDSEDKTETYKRFLKLISSRSFRLADGSPFTVTPQHNSWNAGIMFFHPSHRRFIPDVYTLTDQFFPGSGSHASEQYAFSLMLQENTEISPCESVIYHYWLRPKKAIVDQFLGSRLNDQWAGMPLQAKLEMVKGWTAMLPGYFGEHEFMIRDGAIQAFNEKRYKTGYYLAGKLLAKAPVNNIGFLKDVVYHLKRQISGK
jgi:hypothetical protein